MTHLSDGSQGASRRQQTSGTKVSSIHTVFFLVLSRNMASFRCSSSSSVHLFSVVTRSQWEKIGIECQIHQIDQDELNVWKQTNDKDRKDLAGFRTVISNTVVFKFVFDSHQVNFFKCIFDHLDTSSGIFEQSLGCRQSVFLQQNKWARIPSRNHACCLGILPCTHIFASLHSALCKFLPTSRRGWRQLPVLPQSLLPIDGSGV
jgi:hypothetical protein